jgi:hypothetical protein
MYVAWQANVQIKAPNTNFARITVARQSYALQDIDHAKFSLFTIELKVRHIRRSTERNLGRCLATEELAAAAPARLPCTCDSKLSAV